MLINFIYGVPTWLMGSTVIGLTVALSLTGLAITHRFLHFDLRRRHNEFAGFTSALVGIVFAVLLAFIAVIAWESFAKARETAEREAALTGDLFRDATVMPDALERPLIAEVRDYVAIILDQEWPAMAAGKPVGQAGWLPLQRFHRTLSTFDTANPMQVALITETLTRLNSLYDARRERLLAAQGHIEATVWAVLLLGTAITIVFTYLFGMESFRLHMLMTGFLATTLALVLVLIIAFDYPFRGGVQVLPEGFRIVQRNMESAGISFTPAGKAQNE